ncbi:MAG: GAF domain-containing protein [Acidobacteriota bacterium]
MSRRIDALGSDVRRLGVFPTGRLLDRALDDELQAIVATAAQRIGAPIGLVSLVLHRTQFFRAHYGLPDDLAVTRSTARDCSFCQFVVADDLTLSVPDAAEDPRLPQELVEDWGVRAYLGVPLRLGDVVLGSLCVIDLEPRSFTDDDRAVLESLGERASDRLRELRNEEPESEPKVRALRPAFAQLRDEMTVLRCGMAECRVTAHELAPWMDDSVVQGSSRAETALPPPGVLIGDLRDRLTELERTSESIISMLTALESMNLSTERPRSLGQLMERSETLASHHLRLVGGVTWDAPDVERPLGPDASHDLVELTSMLSELSLYALSTRSEGRLEARWLEDLPGFELCFDGPGRHACRQLTLSVS